MYIVSEYAQQYFQDTLHQTQAGMAIALPYFKERGFTDDTIKKFKLGYSLDEWTAFTDTAIKKRISAGVFGKDRFDGRK